MDLRYLRVKIKYVEETQLYSLRTNDAFRILRTTTTAV